MQLQKIALATLVASGVMGGNAYALAPNAINPQAPTANDVVLHYAGATAQSDTVSALAAEFCAPGSMDTYTDVGGIGSETAKTITCTLLNAAPVPAAIRGRNLYFAYYLAGGSIYGVTPVIDQVSLNYMKVFGGTCAGATPTWTCQNRTSTPSDRYAAIPVAGGSDVEPAMFKGSNVVGLPFSSPTGSAYFATPAYNVVFGIAVSCNLLDHSVYTSCVTDATHPSGPITSLSKASIASIFAGGKIYWEQIPEAGFADRDANGVRDMDDYMATGVGTEIHVCRRLPGSGTQAGAQAFFLNQECGSPDRPFVTAATAAIPGSVQEFESSSQILTNCANTAPNAIAVSSLEKKPGTKYGTNWAYVAIDGVLPTEENAALGYYDYSFENSMQYNTVAISTAQQSFVNELFNRAKQATVLAGKPGVLGLPDGTINLPADLFDIDGDTITAEYVSANPVSWTTRDGKACKAHVSVFP